MRIIHTFVLLLLALASTALAEVKPPLVLVPKGTSANDSLPVAIWLHGYGSNPSKIVEEPLYQQAADRLHIAIVGVYATNPIGPDSFEWSELPTFDETQILESLKTAERTANVHFTRKMFFGFSQGACVAAEIAARHPETYDGAIILSPGSNQAPGPLPAHDGAKQQTYFLSVGAGEAPGNIQFTHAYATYLARLGATVHTREVPDMKVHSRPPDWAERFSEWVGVILKLPK